MDILPRLQSKLEEYKKTFTNWVLGSRMHQSVIYASKSKLLLSLFYSSAFNKKAVKGCFTSGREVISYLKKSSAGILICTIELDDITGDTLIQQANLIQPKLRCMLIADHSNYSADEAKNWKSSVILSGDDIGDENEPWRMSMLSAIANTSFRSKSITQRSEDAESMASNSLTKREKDILECFAMGLTNAEAAERLNLSPRSTKTYSTRLLAKLNVSNRQLALIKVFGSASTFFK
jgi:DNA-binding NarL/FixJ family response regulator